jgi:uncharacterized protein YhaN
VKKFLVSTLRAVTFGKFTGKTIDGFEHPFVVVHGPNESGKSTITEFITWMIGGPVGNTADAQRFGDAGSTLTGELNGAIGESAVEIKGKFNVLATQRWTKNSAERKGYLNGSPIDATSIEAIFGGIPSSDYAFIYRFIGPVLHETESSDSFETLMSQFAMGSASADVDPSAVERELRKRAEEFRRKIEAADGKLKGIGSERRTLESRPARIEEINSELNKISSAIKDLDNLIEANARREGFLIQAINAFDKTEEWQASLRTHAGLEVPNALWEQAVENASEIRRLLEETSTTEPQLLKLRQDAYDLAVKIGSSVEDLGDCTFSLDDKNRVRRAGTTWGTAQDNLSQAQSKVADGSEISRLKMSAVREAAQKLSVTSEDIQKIPALMGTWNELNSAAITWANAEDDARLKREAADSAIVSAGAARQKLSIEAARLPSGSTISRKSLLYPIAVVGVIGAVGSFVSPFISVAAGVVIIGLLAWSFFKGESSSSLSEDNGLQSLRDEVALAERRVTDEGADADRARIGADSKREAFSTRLAAFGLVLPSSEVAQDLCLRIKAAEQAVTELAQAEDHQRTNRESLARFEQEEADAAKVFADVCEETGISYSGNLDDLGEWLDAFDSAISQARQFIAKDRSLDSQKEKVVQLLGAASSEASGLSRERLLLELKHHEEAAISFGDSLKVINEREIAASAASGGKEEVLTLLAESETKEELSARVESLKRNTTEHSDRRDELIEKRRSLSDERSAIENVEYINEIKLRESEQAEIKEEAEFHRDSAALAAATLSAVIDVFERENQGPLVTRANELLNSVVPGYGDLVYKRDESGKALIERVSETSRLRTSKLSVGSRALAYLALRLAFVEADHAKRGVALPVLCDDPLVHIDDQRAPEVMKILAQASGERQVILFTCHDDTRDLAVAAGAHVVSL